MSSSHPPEIAKQRQPSCGERCTGFSGLIVWGAFMGMQLIMGCCGRRRTAPEPAAPAALQAAMQRAQAAGAELGR